MATVAYVDHSFHRTTKSTGFLPEILRRHGHVVDEFWDEAWQGGAPVAWEAVRSYDVVIMFQSYCPPPGMNFRRAHPNVIYIPMLDQFGLWQGPLLNLSAFWEPFQGSKVLNFSNAVHAMTTGFGIASHFARYYQPAADYPPPPGQGLHGFFWLRRERELPWRVIRRLIAKTRFDSLHVHLATDPGTPPATPPSAEELARHNITTSTWFDDKAELNAIIARANIYFAPRLEEGIGQSFLEAMARGQCVVAPNHGTMNEYILPGVNGLLYDSGNPAALDFSNIAELGRQARQGALFGRALWEQAEQALVDFILTPSATLYQDRYQHPALSAPEADGRAETSTAPSSAPGNSLAWALRRAAGRYAVLRPALFFWRRARNLISKPAKLSELRKHAARKD
ncbi:glycosyltransferase [Bosea caraganae]|uniref:Glycosyltransferase n=1 Tax=Bosea caraganae TaxID=2763117 RepID=A0A370L7P0_9HYPH|nr:glycosyltransferase [Bosea caraganae]RDJ25058.1 glycosyltransferase [Bosea caraganae]RDJ26168.1 glycosyltransferase [Bosea caraganae]